MLRCPECGSMVQDGSEFCPHCGRIMSESDNITEEEFRAYTAPKRNYMPILILLCGAMLVLPLIFGAFAPHDNGPDYGPMDREVEWDMYDYSTFSRTSHEPVGHFSITYTVDLDEYKTAVGSPIPRIGSMLNERDAEGHVAVRDYVVVGKTVSDLCYKLCDAFAEFIGTHPQYNTSVYFADYLLSFVETVIAYEFDTVTHNADDYWNYPVQTLYELKGDCEDTSILLSAIYWCMHNLEYTGPDGFSPGTYIVGSCCFGMPAHFMAGVLTKDPLIRDAPYAMVFAHPQGEDNYYFCETTGEQDTIIFSIGMNNDPETYARFYTGYSSVYFTL